MVYNSSEIQDADLTQSRLWSDSVGCVSAEYAYLYPPGSPLIVPGERISPETAGLLEHYRMAGFSIEGLETAGRIRVLREDACGQGD